MENSLGAIFDKIPCTIAHGHWPHFGATLNRITLNFLQNICIPMITILADWKTSDAKFLYLHSILGASNIGTLFYTLQ